MKEAINNLHEVIKDYRKDEIGGISKEHITNWINQFAENDKVFILQELKHILEKTYFSKEKVKSFLKEIINGLTKKFEYQTPQEFLDNSSFLNLQEKGKSQGELLNLLHEILKEEFNYNPEKIGCKAQKHYIYIDDVLCSGNTFYKNMIEFLSKDNLSKLHSKEISLNILYLFIAKDFFFKKKKQLYYNLNEELFDLAQIESLKSFDKELLKPIEKDLSQSIIDYKNQVEEQVNEHLEGENYNTEPNFFRKEINPENFFSSIENRKRLELIFLEKGIEILSKANINKQNIRSLGYSLPSRRNFGFGALIFTWRNIANNTPLVFWYRGGGFNPLFKKKESSSLLSYLLK